MAGKLKIRIVAMAAAAVVTLPIATYAAPTTMHATASFLTAITLSAANLDFSKIDYTAAPAAGDTLRVATNGAPTFSGAHWTADPAAASAAGTITVTAATVGQTVNISCTLTATLSDGVGGGGRIPLVLAEITTVVGGIAGAASPCVAIGTTSTTKLLAGGDVFRVGATLTGTGYAGAWTGGAYSTASTGGTPLQVQVLYQ